MGRGAARYNCRMQLRPTAAPGAGALQIDDLEHRIAYRQRRDVGASSSHSECGRIINSQRVCSHPLYPLSSRGDCSRSTGEASPSSAAVMRLLTCVRSALRCPVLGPLCVRAHSESHTATPRYRTAPTSTSHPQRAIQYARTSDLPAGTVSLTLCTARGDTAHRRRAHTHSTNAAL